MDLTTLDLDSLGSTVSTSSGRSSLSLRTGLLVQLAVTSLVLLGLHSVSDAENKDGNDDDNKNS